MIDHLAGQRPHLLTNSLNLTHLLSLPASLQVAQFTAVVLSSENSNLRFNLLRILRIVHLPFIRNL